MDKKTIDIRGNKFGRLTPIEKVPPIKGRSMWKCRCDCGNTTVVRAEHIRSGASTSCGCYALESQTKHGKVRSLEYNSWQSMKDRCLNPDSPSYARYGGRGLKICPQWIDSFDQFFADMGIRPSASHSLGRIDNDGGYTPGNCRWETPYQQVYNRSNTLTATLNGVTKPVKKWCEELGIVSYQVARLRIKRGVPPHLAVTVKGHQLRNIEY